MLFDLDLERLFFCVFLLLSFDFYNSTTYFFYFSKLTDLDSDSELEFEEEDDESELDSEDDELGVVTVILS